MQAYIIVNLPLQNLYKAPIQIPSTFDNFTLYISMHGTIIIFSKIEVLPSLDINTRKHH